MTPRPQTALNINANALASRLRARIEGEVRFDAGSRALYATDGSNYRQVPIGIVIPRTLEDVVETVALCREYGAPVLSRGGGTSLAGQCCNVAVIIDMSKYLNRILALDPENKLARVQPGLILDNLRHAAEEHHLTFAPDPATHTHNTLGGMIGNNSCGVHSVMGGRTSDNIHELEVLTYEGLRMRVGATSDDELRSIIAEGGRRGEIYEKLKGLRDRYAELIRRRYPKIPRRVSGYGLDELLPENGFHVARSLVGSEGTCVAVLEATVRLIPSPPVRSLLVLGYPDVYSAGDHVTEIMEHRPTALEGMDDRLVDDMKAIGLHPKHLELLPDGGGWLIVEFGGETREEADAQAQRVMEALKKQAHPPAMRLFNDPKQEKRVWKIRESGLGATAHVPNKAITWPGWEDSAVPPEKLGGYLRDLRGLLEKYDYECDLYGHFGQGCVHVRIDFDLKTMEGLKTYRAFLNEATDLVVRYGGSFSGEHGDGQSRAEFLPKMFGPELIEAFREFKSVWDPGWKMNPGKVINPFRVDENLRLGTHYNPPQPLTHFKFPKDNGDFGRVTLRCVGVGECRRESGGTMCPSFMVTKEEKHSTRGRARLLFEMLQGEVIKDGWKSEEVREALHLCLSCKGCKADCPVSVDMATYKAEFMSHYFEGRLRPREAYVYGLIDVWSRWASRMPALVNFFTQAPVLRDLAKTLVGMPSARQFPQFAPQTFTRVFASRIPSNADKPPVILWPDTFNNHYYPETLVAACEVLEAAGFQVRVPTQPLCCGRPLYEFGMLDRAKRQLMRIINALRTEIESGVPVVVLEPACASVFRDELTNLFPANEEAKRLRQQTYLLCEFLDKKAQDYTPPRLAKRAIMHGHCHHRAIMKMDAEERCLEKLGLDFETLDSGCCGMAGSFGFEKDKYEVSIQCGERVLLPAVRRASPETLIIADGFSCREQIAQTTNRRALHLAQAIQMAIRQA
jgi:FAD/FMN-containing dehydrogenase/Fe-S oxidoreductase